ASHELRTPLTALQLQLHGIKEKAARVDAALADKVEKARRSTDRLAMLTEALLDVARISTGRLALNLSEFEMGAAVKDVVERLSESAQRSGTEISLDAQAGVKGCWDPLRVEQIVSNLISNAIKYAAGAKVEISVRGDDKEACIVVRDHGPGIPMNALPRIFERFERGHSMRHFGGLGLGLYVAQQITEAHGGRIRAENAEGGGAKFTVNLPLKPTTPAPAAT
ncbi:MAG: sensor histidine kinase, partial [Myxococcaceae bacterium]